MTRDNIVYSICGLLLGLIIGSFLIGPRLARTKLAGNPVTEPPAATQASASGDPMPQIRQQLETLRARVAENPADFDALTQLANMYMDAAKYPQAIDYYEKALAVRNEPGIRTDLGICYKQSGQTDKAIAAFEQVTREAPSQWQAAFNLAILYAESGRKDDARAQLTRLKSMNVASDEVARLEQAIASQ